MESFEEVVEGSESRFRRSTSRRTCQSIENLLKLEGDEN